MMSGNNERKIKWNFQYNRIVIEEEDRTRPLHPKKKNKQNKKKSNKNVF